MEVVLKPFLIIGRKSPSGSQCAVYIGNEVIGILDADGQTQEAVADTRFAALQP
jgi:hypothetical protein